LPELLKRLQTVNAGHQNVQQNQVRFQPLVDFLQRFLAGACGLDFVVIDL
jgi:hypothetical protein